MTYMYDSDVIIRYGGFTRKEQPITLELEEAWRKKNKTVVWVVSHCHAHSKRENFVKELEKHIDIDIYGACGPLKCARNLRESCYRMFGEQYYFYLSLENSLCDEYVTEKLYYPLQLNIIPVALSAVNYEVKAPPHSVIDVASFATPRHLADYLKRVMSDYDLYKSYLEWKRDYDVREWHGYDESFCGLCEKLHGPELRTYSAYDSVRSWWTNKSACYTYNDSTWIAVQSKIKLVGSPLTSNGIVAN
ncbi:alpha-(1,3)-fucosyltransferase C-like [Ornithodoros turicata]|uniref:alpha-(1,3)-fucosyltransferase C-like n=1 Tax=Ornithodoros turicata TaxID=34597 RepID=UPI003139D715